jgi:YlmC/YmxH family sporulation protein
MRICELRQKEVINCKTCKRLGYVSDLEFDITCGKILAIIVPGPCRIWGIIGHDHEYVIPYHCITQIGDDIIIVDVDEEKVYQVEKPC